MDSIEKIKDDKPLFQPITERFARKSRNEDDQLKKETIGLETLDSFRRKKQDIALEGPPLSKDGNNTKKRKPNLVNNKLSFLAIDDEDEEEGSTSFFDGTKRILINDRLYSIS